LVCRRSIAISTSRTARVPVPTRTKIGPLQSATASARVNAADGRIHRLFMAKLTTRIATVFRPRHGRVFYEPVDRPFRSPLQLKSRETKAFRACSARFGRAAQTRILVPVCLASPGATAGSEPAAPGELGIPRGTGPLHLKVPESFPRFGPENYFYPTCRKGYQISHVRAGLWQPADGPPRSNHDGQTTRSGITPAAPGKMTPPRKSATKVFFLTAEQKPVCGPTTAAAARGEIVSD